MNGLRPHQVRPASDLCAILAKHNSAVDFSDCGTGKTYVACAVAKQLARPTLVIGPKISATQWHAAASHFSDELDFIGYEMLRTGGTPYGTWERPLVGGKEDREYFQCTVCQQRVCLGTEFRPCPYHHGGIHCVQTKKVAWNYGKFLFNPSIKFLVFDEVHRAGGLDSLNGEMLIAAKRSGITTLGLSATAACNPLNLRALGYLLDLHNLDKDKAFYIKGGVAMEKKKSFFSWARSLGVWRDPRFHGLKWFAGESEQQQGMAKIRAAIIPDRGVRVSTRDIPDFPACSITAELYDIEGADKIDGIYAKMADALERLKVKAAGDKAPDHPLTVILRARQKIEILKVPVAAELAEDYLAKGHSVALFVDFTETLIELAKRFPDAAQIHGRQTAAERLNGIARYQSGAARVILVQNAAGGVAVSLHDLHGNFPRVGLVFPPFSAVTIRQVFGRLPRDGGKSPSLYRVIFAANTVEVRMQRALRAKLNNLDTLNDSDLTPANLVL